MEKNKSLFVMYNKKEITMLYGRVIITRINIKDALNCNLMGLLEMIK